MKGWRERCGRGVGELAEQLVELALGGCQCGLGGGCHFTAVTGMITAAVAAAAAVTTTAANYSYGV